jgi:hypothetical protein
MRGRLNLFQAAMLRWRELYPYNAVHVAELPGPLDVDRLERAIAHHLESLGLTGLTLDAAGCRYDFAGGPATVRLAVIEGGGDPAGVLNAAIERELNVPFPPRGPLDPFRFFAVRAGDGFHLGIAYDHFVAGGDSIVTLLKGMAGRYAGNVPAAAPLDVHPPAYARLFLRNAGYWYLGQFWLPAMILRARRSVRPRYPWGDGATNAFAAIDLDRATYAGVVATARNWGVTQNDMLLAMLLHTLGPEVGGRNGQRRHEIAIASVINIRKGFVPGPEHTFGQFLSSFLVSHPVPEGVDLRTLASEMHRQTQRVKRRKLFLQTLYAIGFGGFAWRYMTPSQRKHMYAKNYPVWAGMTMLNVEAIWNNHAGDVPVLSYLRAGSTGPFSPMVLTPASVGGRMRIGVSYRTAAFKPEDIARMSAAFVQSARNL